MGVSNVGRARLVAATLVAACLGALPVVASQQPEPTFLAIVRSDGSMIPIAAFDGQWWNRWPVSSSNPDIPPLPSSVSSIPPSWLPPGLRLPIEWRLHTIDGRQVRIKALRPIRTSMLEAPAIGLETGYTWKPTGADVGGALAVAGPATVGRFVATSQRESEAIGKQLAERLAAIERLEIARWIKESELPGDTASRLRRVVVRNPDEVARPPLALVRAEQRFDDKTYYHLTGENLYALPGVRDDGCKMNMSFDGVVAADRAGRVVFEKVTASAWDGYCGDPASSAEPIAAVQVGGRLIWAAIENLEDGFSYFLLDPHTNKPLELNYAGRR